MSYVFFDLEWNQGYPHGDTDKLDEIIQLGAYRLDHWQDEGENFSAYVRPSIHKKLHHRVRKLLPLDQQALKAAEPFQEVINQFFRWCGPEPVFFTWGGSDARVLDMNLCWYGMEEYLDLEIYDLQRAYDLLVLQTDQQASLKDAVETLALDALLEYHDAGNDAFYTACIGAELVRRFGALPSEAELSRGEAELRARRQAEAAHQAQEMLGALLESGKPLLNRPCGIFNSQEDCLKSRGARMFRCPECQTSLCAGNWYQLGDRYLARSRCLDHGRYYTCVTISPGEDGFEGRAEVFDESFPAELFHLCKQGGELIPVSRTARKRRHRHRRVSVDAPEKT